MEKIIILGKGGHAESLADIIEREKKYEIAGYVVNDISGNLEDEIYPVIGNDLDLEQIFEDGIRNAAIGIGYLGKSDVRERLWEKLKTIGFSLPVICDPSAVIAKNAKLGEGTMVGKGVIVNANASVGKMCIINTGAIIEHDCVVGDFSHISVGSVLCGNVEVGKSTFVGANATVIQGKSVGNWCIIGAGTTIRKSVEDNIMICDRKTFRLIGGGYKLTSQKGCAA